MSIQSGSTVTIDYRLSDGEGNVIENTADDEPVTYEHGIQEILPGLEDALTGKDVGDELSVTLVAADAYGEYDPEGLLTIPRQQLPDDYEGELGEMLTLGLDPSEAEEHGIDGDEIDVRVVELHPDQIVVDANHPLAGKDLTFELVIRGIE